MKFHSLFYRRFQSCKICSDGMHGRLMECRDLDNRRQLTQVYATQSCISVLPDRCGDILKSMVSFKWRKRNLKEGIS
ncbi:hypothetical protein CLOSTMETH_01873 [[Clostridium] methylpentosum DSM 5476]|uniref:Uncharacterized protein n=1 Tax=[Clostridium] methylpentosum DSM 5476 TaxID=537013 RepID=C0EDE6_9FIRM|nr:hypothetical protein CLOSTMETH_01873 [[Clostridium] methylpentosum DSM 5476]